MALRSSRPVCAAHRCLCGRLAKGPYILGEQFTAADVVIGSGLRFGMLFKLLPEREEFIAYTGRLAQRGALLRAEAKDKEFSAA